MTEEGQTPREYHHAINEMLIQDPVKRVPVFLSNIPAWPKAKECDLLVPSAMGQVYAEAHLP